MIPKGRVESLDVAPGHGFRENPDISWLERQERGEAGAAAERLGVPDPANSPRSRSFGPSPDDPGSAAAIKAKRSRCSRARSGPSRAPPPPITPTGAPPPLTWSGPRSSAALRAAPGRPAKRKIIPPDAPAPWGPQQPALSKQRLPLMLPALAAKP